jgi:putative ABC transport system substrate-binding protein
MDRRRFLLTSVAGTLAAPRAAGAQQSGKPTIGILDLGSAAGMRRWDALREGLRDLGHVEGQTLAIEYRFAQDQTSRLPALVAELVALKVKVIVTAGTTSIRAAKDATNTIPIVITAGADPVEMGFAHSLARPGGNITGLSILASRRRHHPKAPGAAPSGRAASQGRRVPPAGREPGESRIRESGERGGSIAGPRSPCGRGADGD